ncbi:MAG: site-2 protease family protein [Phycisphaerae bacterium]|nr:site-2 protease family protein [Phycisphaerae bacterium]
MTFDLTLLLAQAEPASWLSGAWSIFLLVIGFSLVIFVHELGHFLAAKWAKVRVEKFCIGFGKELFGFTRGGTRYGFNILPLGGYVKMLGQEDFVVDKSGELKVKDDPDSFTNKPIGTRMVIVSAGVVMNVLFAAVAFAIVVMVGRLEMPAIVGSVDETTPAGRAGVQTGDKILAINGTTIRSFGDLSARIMLSDPDETLELEVERDGKIVSPAPKVLPEFKKDEQIRQIGIGNPENLRVLVPSIRPNEERLEGELQEYDRLYGLVVDGVVKEFKDVGPFSHAVKAARGAPVEIVVKRPKDPDALTDEMLLQSDPTVETTEATVQARAIWAPLAFDASDEVRGSLLGLVPRMTVAPLPGKSFEKAGVQIGDVVTRIGNHAYPVLQELKEVIDESPDQEVAIEVRRTRAANHGLAARTVEFCVRNRETLIVTALQGGAARALAEATTLAGAAGLPGSERDKLLAKLGGLGDGPSWRRWLERVDIHELAPIVPKREFSLFGLLGLADKPLPKIDAAVNCIDEDHLVVADVVEKFGDRTTPAHAACIPPGAVILSVDGQRVTQWYELSEAFRAKAGHAVELTYRVADDIRTTKMVIPDCISNALHLNLASGTRIVKIDGKTKYPVEVEAGKTQDISLPDWRVIEGVLKASIGKTVQIEYVTYDNERHTADYTVTAENSDPWLHRVWFAAPFRCYPLRERHPIHNPIAAVGVGFRQAYDATMQTIQSIRHMVFTGRVGVSKVSGPVGIVRIGAKFADTGVLNLLWFLAVISANLAVINFLPLPIVDGGLFLFLVMEKARGEPVSIKTQIATQLIGIALIATLFLLITYQDIKNWIIGA